jgi:trigger factor
MRATASVIENNKVKLVVEVDEQELSLASERTAAELAKQVNIKGFRKGKVPRNVLVANIGGPQVLRAETLRDALPDFYAKAVSETLIDPINQPEINITGGEEEGVLTFEADVEVRPTVDVQGYKDLKVTIPSPVVNDADVDATIDRYRDTDAILNEVERPVATGDLVVLDLKVEKIDAEEGEEPFEMSDYMYTVGSGQITDGVDELIVGLRAGEELKVNGAIGNGQTATYTMQIKQVKERVLPELTDEWCEENTDWSTVQEMRDAIVDQLRRRKVIEAQMSQRDAVLMAISDLVPADAAPQVLIEQETQERLHDLGHRLSQQNIQLDMFLQMTNQTPDELLETMRQDAQRAVRIDLALRGVAAAQGLTPTEAEVEEELVRTAESMSVAADVLRSNLHDTGRTVTFVSEVAKMKASRWLNENLTFIDENGVTIDKTLLTVDQSLDLDA